MPRPLGAFETAATITGEELPFNAVIVLRLGGGPSREALEAALVALQRRQPLLRVRIARSSGRYVFASEGVPPIPLRVVERDGEDRWCDVAEDELNRRMEAAPGPLARCTLLTPSTDGPGSEIVLCLHHAIIDAASAGTLLRELLAHLDPAARRAGPGDPSSAPLGPPIEELLPPRHRGLRAYPGLAAFLLRQVADEVAYRWRARAARKPPIHETATSRVLSREISAEATDRLVRSARRHRATVASVASAAMLLAVQRLLYSGDEVPMRHFTFADLRPYLEPPLSGASLGSYISMLRYTVPMCRHQPLWPLARRITAQVGGGGHRGDKLYTVRMAPAMMRTILGQKSFRMGTTAVSYVGAVRLPDRVGPIEVRGLHAWVSNIPLGPEYTAHVRLFRRRLCWDILYLDADLGAERAAVIADHIVEILDAAADQE
jgi:hypothetical protein